MAGARHRSLGIPGRAHRSRTGLGGPSRSRVDSATAPRKTRDTDHDGINDEEDDCPLQPGTAEWHGCPPPDTDHDGVDDEHDSCKTVPGLARYHDLGEGPVPEMADDSSYYPDVIRWLLAHPNDHPEYLVPGAAKPSSAQAKQLAHTSCDITASHVCALAVVDGQRLSAAFYRSYRAMRESGFDPSFRFGPFDGDTHHYAPVCLNSLLYKTEKDLEQISLWLGHADDAKKWKQRAELRKQRITHYLWNAEQGLFFDFNFQTRRMSNYRYASTFYPLWAGLATPEQAKAVVGNLKAFDRPGGIPMSTEESGAQWDLPYGWGNIEMVVIDGLRRYGFNPDADRVSYQFLSTVAENFRHDGTIKEKYNVVTRSSEAHVELGYEMNVVGFGWTNAAFLELLHGLPKDMVDQLEKEQNQPLPTAR